MSTHVMELPGTELEGFQEALNVLLEKTRCPFHVHDQLKTHFQVNAEFFTLFTMV